MHAPAFLCELERMSQIECISCAKKNVNRIELKASKT